MFKEPKKKKTANAFGGKRNYRFDAPCKS